MALSPRLRVVNVAAAFLLLAAIVFMAAAIEYYPMYFNTTDVCTEEYFDSFGDPTDACLVTLQTLCSADFLVDGQVEVLEMNRCGECKDPNRAGALCHMAMDIETVLFTAADGTLWLPSVTPRNDTDVGSTDYLPLPSQMLTVVPFVTYTGDVTKEQQILEESFAKFIAQFEVFNELDYTADGNFTTNSKKLSKTPIWYWPAEIYRYQAQHTTWPAVGVMERHLYIQHLLHRGFHRGFDKLYPCHGPGTREVNLEKFYNMWEATAIILNATTKYCSCWENWTGLHCEQPIHPNAMAERAALINETKRDVYYALAKELETTQLSTPCALTCPGLMQPNARCTLCHCTTHLCAETTREYHLDWVRMGVSPGSAPKSMREVLAVELNTLITGLNLYTTPPPAGAANFSGIERATLLIIPDRSFIRPTPSGVVGVGWSAQERNAQYLQQLALTQSDMGDIMVTDNTPAYFTSAIFYITITPSHNITIADLTNRFDAINLRFQMFHTQYRQFSLTAYSQGTFAITPSILGFGQSTLFANTSATYPNQLALYKKNLLNHGPMYRPLCANQRYRSTSYNWNDPTTHPWIPCPTRAPSPDDNHAAYRIVSKPTCGNVPGTTTPFLQYDVAVICQRIDGFGVDPLSPVPLSQQQVASQTLYATLHCNGNTTSMYHQWPRKELYESVCIYPQTLKQQQPRLPPPTNITIINPTVEVVSDVYKTEAPDANMTIAATAEGQPTGYPVYTVYSDDYFHLTWSNPPLVNATINTTRETIPHNLLITLKHHCLINPDQYSFSSCPNATTNLTTISTYPNIGAVYIPKHVITTPPDIEDPPAAWFDPNRPKYSLLTVKPYVPRVNATNDYPETTFWLNILPHPRLNMIPDAERIKHEMLRAEQCIANQTTSFVNITTAPVNMTPHFTCNCPYSWAGKTCAVCDPEIAPVCFPLGTLSSTCTECTCKPEFSGPLCDHYNLFGGIQFKYDVAPLLEKFPALQLHYLHEESLSANGTVEKPPLSINLTHFNMARSVYQPTIVRDVEAKLGEIYAVMHRAMGYINDTADWADAGLEEAGLIDLYDVRLIRHEETRQIVRELVFRFATSSYYTSTTTPDGEKNQTDSTIKPVYPPSPLTPEELSDDESGESSETNTKSYNNNNNHHNNHNIAIEILSLTQDWGEFSADPPYLIYPPAQRQQQDVGAVDFLTSSFWDTLDAGSLPTPKSAEELRDGWDAVTYTTNGESPIKSPIGDVVGVGALEKPVCTAAAAALVSPSHPLRLRFFSTTATTSASGPTCSTPYTPPTLANLEVDPEDRPDYAKPPSPRPPPIPQPNDNPRDITIFIVIGIVVGTAVLIAIATLFIVAKYCQLCCFAMKKQNNENTANARNNNNNHPHNAAHPHAAAFNDDIDPNPEIECVMPYPRELYTEKETKRGRKKSHPSQKSRDHSRSRSRSASHTNSRASISQSTCQAPTTSSARIELTPDQDARHMSDVGMTTGLVSTIATGEEPDAPNNSNNNSNNNNNNTTAHPIMSSVEMFTKTIPPLSLIPQDQPPPPPPSSEGSGGEMSQEDHNNNHIITTTPHNNDMTTIKSRPPSLIIPDTNTPSPQQQQHLGAEDVATKKAGRKKKKKPVPLKRLSVYSRTTALSSQHTATMSTSHNNHYNYSSNHNNNKNNKNLNNNANNNKPKQKKRKKKPNRILVAPLPHFVPNELETMSHSTKFTIHTPTHSGRRHPVASISGNYHQFDSPTHNDVRGFRRASSTALNSQRRGSQVISLASSRNSSRQSSLTQTITNSLSKPRGGPRDEAQYHGRYIRKDSITQRDVKTGFKRLNLIDNDNFYYYYHLGDGVKDCLFDHSRVNHPITAQSKTAHSKNALSKTRSKRTGSMSRQKPMITSVKRKTIASMVPPKLPDHLVREHQDEHRHSQDDNGPITYDDEMYDDTDHFLDDPQDMYNNHDMVLMGGGGVPTREQRTADAIRGTTALPTAQPHTPPLCPAGQYNTSAGNHFDNQLHADANDARQVQDTEVLPNGWQLMVYVASGEKFYINVDTGATQRLRPTNDHGDSHMWGRG